MRKAQGLSSVRRGLAWAALAGVSLLCAMAPVAWAGETADSALRISGSSTMCPLVESIGQRFRTLRPGVRIDVQCGGSDRGIKDLREGHVDIAMVARALKGEEKDLSGFPMARDGASIIVHHSNPLTSLADDQVVGIFSGRIDNWRAITGKDARIAVILREKEKPISELFEKHFKLAGRIQGEVVEGDNPVTISVIAADPDAIGYVSSGEAERNAKAGAAIRLVSIGGVVPTERNIITGNYPLTRPLSLVTRQLPAGVARDFIEYCLSPKVVDLVERFGFVPYED